MLDDIQTTSHKREIKRKKFTGDEDEEIRRLVEAHGTTDWTMIAEEMGNGRTKRQIRERWQSYLNPELETEYNEADDELLRTLRGRLGPKWSVIAVALGRKSGISVRNRYRTLQTQKKKGFKPDYCRESMISGCEVWSRRGGTEAVGGKNGGCEDGSVSAIEVVDPERSFGGSGHWELDFDNFVQWN
jgi:hypothetical protein